jgi:rubrerythrin
MDLKEFNMSDENLVEFLEEMVKIEEKIVKSVKNSLDSLKNPAVNAVLKGISYDSMKHSLMYQSAISLVSNRRLPLEESQLNEQRKLVDKHIMMEEAVIEKLNKITPTIEDKRLKLIFNAIIDDERKHHKLLKQVQEILVRGETITEQEWWEAIWKDVPGLWT